MPPKRVCARVAPPSQERSGANRVDFFGDPDKLARLDGHRFQSGVLFGNHDSLRNRYQTPFAIGQQTRNQETSTAYTNHGCVGCVGSEQLRPFRRDASHDIGRQM